VVRFVVPLGAGGQSDAADDYDFLEMKRIDVRHPLVDVVPSDFATFADNDPTQRIVVLANDGNDLTDYWEWSSTGMVPVSSTNDVYKLGVNIVYGLTH
jgi:uncharacterized protein DUF4159